jgi:ATP-binding cassette subfamily F protein 3
MLRLTRLSLARGARVLYKDASLLAPPGERIGLVGANGCGKSSLFAAILHDLGIEAGSIEAPPQDRIAHVAQDIEAIDCTALEYVLQGHAPLVRAREELAVAETSHDEMALAHAHASLADANEGAITAQAAVLLRGLGFAPGAEQRKVTEFSGGWRNRLALAKALLRPADLLLLDEPTNHLDLDSVIWLEAWLRRQSATVLVISHDREFLDRCVTVIWHVAEESIRRYAGNYSSFEMALVERNRQQDAASRNVARTAAHLQSFVDRFRAQATKARQAQSRMKMLEKLVSIEPSRSRREWRFEFLEPDVVPERLVEMADVSLGYGKDPILQDVRLLVQAGDRIGILGVNGAGKSTLVKAIVGSLTPSAGSRLMANGTRVGYFAQHQLDQLDPDDSPLVQLRRIAPRTREQELRDFLGNFRFAGELATAPVGRMSGGEKARCALALIAWTRPNLLVLDEPTNHLDMETRDALTIALSSFEGALLLVSHDRHLLRAATETLVLVHDGKVEPFDGDLDEYAALVLASRRDRAAADAAERPSRAKERERSQEQDPAARREDRRAQAQDRDQRAQKRKPIQQAVNKLEKQMQATASELKTIDAKLADPAFYHEGEASAVAEVMRQRTRLSTTLEEVEGRWLKAQSELEALGD